MRVLGVLGVGVGNWYRVLGVKGTSLFLWQAKLNKLLCVVIGVWFFLKLILQNRCCWFWAGSIGHGVFD